MGYGGEVEWAQSVTTPATPEDLWREYAWVVINSGMKNQVAQKIWDRVRPEVEEGGRATSVFGHRQKAAAIDEMWTCRKSRYEHFVHLATMQGIAADTLVNWCWRLPWIGPITKWHLAKNLGVECAKPDRWLERVAAATSETVQELCTRLSVESGDRVATVDLVIWGACNLGLAL